VIISGDLVEQHVDAIVNDANGGMPAQRIR
jgi:O-acetyl-ADP-ribose deacetylase (regulator of RNase III)